MDEQRALQIKKALHKAQYAVDELTLVLDKVELPTAEEPLIGNWVNGVNLDKIKFPRFCSYVYMNVRRFGELRMVSDGRYGGVYKIFNLCQDEGVSSYTVTEYSLEAILENHDVHILKGKIII